MLVLCVTLSLLMVTAFAADGEAITTWTELQSALNAGGTVTATGKSKGAGIGGGEYGHADIAIYGGDITARGGTTGQGSNIYLRGAHPTMTVAGELTDGADIWVTSASGIRVITSGYGASNGTAEPGAFFHADDEQYAVRDYFAGFDRYVEQGIITDPVTIELVHALADYGHYVQLFLSETRGWSLGSDYAEQGTFYATYSTADYRSARLATNETNDFLTYNETNGDIQTVTHSLTLDSETTLNIFFAPSGSYSGTVAATVDGESAACEKVENGSWLVRIENISAHELSVNHTIVVTTDNGTVTVTASGLSYVNSAMYDYSTRNIKPYLQRRTNPWQRKNSPPPRVRTKRR